MLPPPLRRLVAVTAALVLSGSLTASLTAWAATPAVPIPSDPRDALVVPFTGEAVSARPFAPQPLPQNPFMAANGRSNIQSGSGPVGG